MVKSAKNPEGLPLEVFDDLRAKTLTDRSQFSKDIAFPFYGASRPDSKVSEGLRESFWLQAMMCGFKGYYECIKQFSKTDFTEDLKKMDIPTLFIHGDDDQIVPYKDASVLAVKLVKNGQLKLYPGAPHGLPSTHKDQLNADLLAFCKS